jgi:hypothetical protein
VPPTRLVPPATAWVGEEQIDPIREVNLSARVLQFFPKIGLKHVSGRFEDVPRLGLGDRDLETDPAAGKRDEPCVPSAR